MGGRRVIFLDVAKCITAFLVILGHLYSNENSFRFYIYAFHMPLFFFISGIFHKELDFKESIRKYYKTIIVPFMFFLVAGFMTSCLYYEPINLLKNIISSFLHGNSFMACPTAWFLIVLLWCKIFTDVFCKNKLIFSITILLTLLFSINNNILFLKSTLMSIVFYLIGKIAQNKIISISSQIKWSFIPLMIATVILTHFNGRTSTNVVIFGDLAFPINIFVYYINAFIGIFMILSLSLFIRKSNGIITMISNSLLSILGFQYIFIYPIMHFYKLDNSLIYNITASLVILFLCIIIDCTIKKYCPQLLGVSKNKCVSKTI